VPAQVIGKRFVDQATIEHHEAVIRDGHFRFSEQGYDHCLIEPDIFHSRSSHS